MTDCAGALAEKRWCLRASCTGAQALALSNFRNAPDWVPAFDLNAHLMRLGVKPESDSVGRAALAECRLALDAGRLHIVAGNFARKCGGFLLDLRSQFA